MRKSTAHQPPVNHDELIRQAREAGAEAARAELRTILAAASNPRPATYSDRKGHGPPGYSEERSKERVRSCPHAVKRGRWHVVDREAFEAWERSQLPTIAPVVEIVTRKPWTPAGALAEAGLRGRAGG